MHPNIVQDTPGNCSVCGMNLVEAKKDHQMKSGHQMPPKKPALSGVEGSKLVEFLPLVIVLGVIVGLVILSEMILGRFLLVEMMRLFMGFFFLLFGFFKTLDWKAFIGAYAEYDIIAARSKVYAAIYPLIELTLAVLYLGNFYPLHTNIATVIVMGVGSVGVIKAVYGKQKIHCACLGTMVKLPMTTVTIIEDVGMGLMALVMIGLQLYG